MLLFLYGFISSSLIIAADSDVCQSESNGNCSGEFVRVAVLEMFKIEGNLLKLSIKFFQLLTFRSIVNPSVNTEDFEDGTCAM